MGLPNFAPPPSFSHGIRNTMPCARLQRSSVLELSWDRLAQNMGLSLLHITTVLLLSPRDLFVSIMFQIKNETGSIHLTWKQTSDPQVVTWLQFLGLWTLYGEGSLLSTAGGSQCPDGFIAEGTSKGSENHQHSYKMHVKYVFIEEGTQAQSPASTWQPTSVQCLLLAPSDTRSTCGSQTHRQAKNSDTSK